MPPSDFRKAYTETLLTTERLPERELAAYQDDLVDRFLCHAAENVPYYENLSVPRPFDVASAAWQAVPRMDRATVAAHGERMRARAMPSGHGRSVATSSSGSTGNPLGTAVSDLESLGRVVVTYRMFENFGMDPALPLFMIRPKASGVGWTDDLVYRKWSWPWLPEEELGDRLFVDIETPPDDQLTRLGERAPAYVNTLPWNILGLGLAARRTGRAPSLPLIASVAEYLAPEVGKLAAEMFGSRVIDILTSSEAGPIAIQCPESHRLHIQSERVLVEILRDDGTPCEPGETGEIVVTPFYNYAMPLIRYRSGDYVVKGGACSCGRTLPTIDAIAGRKEHMFRYPDGSRRLPPIDRVSITEAFGHDRWQLVQNGEGTAELRHEPPTDGGDAVEVAVADAAAALAPDFTIVPVAVERVRDAALAKHHFTRFEAG